MTIEDEIAGIDECLELFRQAWRDAAPENRERWMQRINEALDDRAHLQKLLDGYDPR